MSTDCKWRDELFEYLSDAERDLLEEYEYHLGIKWKRLNPTATEHITHCEKRDCLECDTIFDREDAWMEQRMKNRVEKWKEIRKVEKWTNKHRPIRTPVRSESRHPSSDTIRVSSSSIEEDSGPSYAQIPTAAVVRTPSVEILAPVMSPESLALEAHLSDRSNCRFKGKNLFLTYPKCNIQKEEMSALLRQLFDHWKPHRVVVGHELHADGTDHLHCQVRLHGSIDTTNARFADVRGYHGNYRISKNVQAVDTYCKKGGDFHEWPAQDASSEKRSEKKRKISDVLSATILEGTSTNSLVRNKDYSSFLLTNLAKVRQFEAFVRQTETTPLLPWPKILPTLTDQNASILRWLALNIWDPRTLRQKQLYLHGPPATGKTSLVQLIGLRMKVYYPSLGEKYFDGLTHEHEMIVFDEFCGGTQLSIMNQILDGQPCILPCRYQHFYKVKNIPVIVLSNMTPEECYSKAHHLRVQAFASRFTIINVTDMINIFV